jgi:hypothetical protein
MGWKEAVRFNPLEDAFIALLPVKQTLAWPLPDKRRPLDVDAPLGTTTQFTGIDIYGQPINVVNDIVNMGWEYVWHCHLLGHEENDMLRGEAFVVAPEAPTGLTAVRTANGASLSWNNPSISAMTFNVSRADDALFTTGVTVVGVAANPRAFDQSGTVTFDDLRTVTNPMPNASYWYRVTAAKALTSVAIPGAVFPAESAPSNIAQAIAAPFAVFAPASLAFGNQVVGSNSTAQTVTLSNTGLASLIYTGITFTGTDLTQFNRSGGTCVVTGGTLAAGASCTVSVRFLPTTVGAKTAALSLASNNAVNPLTVALTGTGAAPIASVKPVVLGFTVATNNTYTAAQQIVLSNTGNAALSLSGGNPVRGITLQLNPNTNFNIQSTTCGTSLAAGATCLINVRFRTQTAGLVTGNLRIVSNSSVNSTINVPLYGNPAAATGVTLTASPAAASYTVGTAVTYTAVGSGAGALPANGYQYQFWTYAGASWVMVQDYGVGNTWTLPGTTPAAADFRVLVYTRTSPASAFQASAQLLFSIRNLPATGVNITPSAPSPHPAGTNVTFTAAGVGGTGTYQYQFYLFDGVNWVMVQDYGLGNSWVLPGTTVPGAYRVWVYVRTNTNVASDTSNQVFYTIQ